LEGTSFVRITPEEPGTFDCDPAFAGKVTGPLLERADLDENRHSKP
jgi:hypothetical protein